MGADSTGQHTQNRGIFLPNICADIPGASNIITLVCSALYLSHICLACSATELLASQHVPPRAIAASHPYAPLRCETTARSTRPLPPWIRNKILPPVFCQSGQVFAARTGMGAGHDAMFVARLFQRRRGRPKLRISRRAPSWRIKRLRRILRIISIIGFVSCQFRIGRKWSGLLG